MPRRKKRHQWQRERWSVQKLRDVFGPRLRGECVLCGQILTVRDYEAQRVVAAIGPEGTVVCCAQHVEDDLEAASRAIGEAKARQLAATDHR